MLLIKKKTKGQASFKFNIFLFFYFFSLCLFCENIQAKGIYATFAPSVRVYPVGGTVESTLGKEWYLYDQRTPKEFWKFGLLALEGKASAHGAIESRLTFYPISFVKIFLGLGGTYRYYNSAGMDCATNICQGFLNRNRIGISFGFTFGENNEYILVPQYQAQFVTHSQGQRMIADETELILASAGGDTLNQSQFFLGKKISKDYTLGLFVKQSQYQNSQKLNEMQLLSLYMDWKSSDLLFGLGRYASSTHIPGITAVIEYSWRWGKKTALF